MTSVGLALAVLAFWCPVGFASEPTAAHQTRAVVHLQADDLAPGARVRLEGRVHLRVLGVEPAEGSESQPRLTTVREVSADPAVSLRLLGGRDAPATTDMIVDLPLDAVALAESDSFHLGFLRLVGDWHLEEPGGDEGSWTSLAEQTLDYEVPVLKTQLTHPTLCVTIETVGDGGDGTRALVTASCEAKPNAQPLD